LLGLLQTLRPAHKTSADVRQHTLQPLRQVCRACTLLGKPLALLAGALVAMDGSTCKAVHATERHVTRDQLQRRRGPSDQRGEAHRSRTAPERRAMPRGQGRGTEVCDTVHTAGDAQDTRLIANDVANAPGDRARRSPMALQAKAVLGGTVAAVADGGSSHGADVQPWLDAGLTPSRARPITSANKQRGRFSTEDCTDDGATDPSQWPAGARLPCRFATVARGRHLRSYATAACKPWALKQQGTRHTGGRRLTRGVEEPLWDAMAQRVRRRPKVRKPRTQWVEHPCGTMQRWWEQGDCLRRGVEKGRTKCRVTVLADNLRRVVNIGGIPQRMAALGEVVVLVWSRLTGKDGMEDKARL
jgi:hypothetical protein